MADNKPIDNTNNPLISHTGHKLTPNESKFIDEYIKLGNATQAYIVAYNKDPENPPKASRQQGAKILSKGYIAEEISFRLSLLQDDTIADAEEIMRYFTDVMRGKISDQFGLEAPLAERTKCAMELAKRQIDMASRTAVVETPQIKITLDWGDDDND